MSVTISNLNSRRQKQSTVVAKSFFGISHLSEYVIEKKLGEGTFGIVYKAQMKDKDRPYHVAIKRILQRDIDEAFPVTAYREMAVLKHLKDDNIIELVDVLVDKPGPLEEKQDMTSKIGKSFYLVFPYMSYDLTGILQDPSINLSVADNKSIMKQMLLGLDFMHKHGFLHRDIKASNILIHHTGVLKIGDFGLARKYKGVRARMTHPGGGTEPMTEVVMTRWYRAPEVLLGNRLYTTAVDLWASGCILGELYERKPILPGKSDLAQAMDIFALVGTPDSRTMPGYDTLKMWPKIVAVRRPPTLHTRFYALTNDHDAVDLMQHLMLLDHKMRYTASKALEHDWFKKEPLPSATVETNFKETHESDVIHKKQKSQQTQPRVRTEVKTDLNTDPDTPSRQQLAMIPPSFPSLPPIPTFNGTNGPKYPPPMPVASQASLVSSQTSQPAPTSILAPPQAPTGLPPHSTPSNPFSQGALVPVNPQPPQAPSALSAPPTHGSIVSRPKRNFISTPQGPASQGQRMIQPPPPQQQQLPPVQPYTLGHGHNNGSNPRRSHADYRDRARGGEDRPSSGFASDVNARPLNIHRGPRTSFGRDGEEPRFRDGGYRRDNQRLYRDRANGFAPRPEDQGPDY